MAERDFGFRDIIDEAKRVAGEQSGMIAILAAGYMVVGLVCDLYAPQLSGLLTGLLAFFMGYEVFRRGLSPRSAEVGRRYGSYLGAAILAGLGTLVGLVFLIIPGIYVAMRWSIASAYVVAEGASSGEALSKSWDATNGRVWPITLAMAVIWIPFVAFMILTGIWADSLNSQSGTLISVAVLNVFTAVVTFAGWVLSISVYRLICGDEGYENVFA